jgi:hypothetical protein
MTQLEALQLLIAWHDRVKEMAPLVPSPYGIDEARRLAEGKGGSP